MPIYGTEEEPAPIQKMNGVARLALPSQNNYDAIQQEIDGYYHDLTTLNSLPPNEVLQMLSSISARVAEIRNRLVALDARRPTALRTKHVDPLHAEVDRQFKIHSRLITWRQDEWDMSKGQT